MFPQSEKEICAAYSAQLQQSHARLQGEAARHTGAVRDRLASRNCQNIFAGTAFAFITVERAMQSDADGNVSIKDQEQFDFISLNGHREFIASLENFAREWVAEARAHSAVM